MQWLYPTYFWALVAVPLVIGLFGWAAWQRHRARQRFGDAATVEQLSAAVRPVRRRWKAGLVALGTLLLVVALAGPRIGTKTRTVEQKGIDLMIALDVSKSMRAEDVAPNRLEHAKNAIKQLLGELSGDRVGLILFAGDAFVQCPLTTDYDAVRLFLDVADPSTVATPGTDFHRAFQVGLEAFSASAAPDTTDPTQPTPRRTQAMLFVSDGENHIGEISSIRSKAEEQSVVLFTAGVGTLQGARIPIYKNGQRAGYKRDDQGQIVNTRLEEEALTSLVQPGSYVRLGSNGGTMADLTEALTNLDRTSLGTEQFASYEERYQWPLALALVLLVGARFIRVRRSSPTPTS